MFIVEHPHTLEVHREGKKFPTESAWWFALKKLLQAQGKDVVKRLMWRDGHMCSDEIYYLRDRKKRFCFFDPNYALRLVTEPEVIKLRKEVWE